MTSLHRTCVRLRDDADKEKKGRERKIDTGTKRMFGQKLI
jgi:hypothetical protein